MTPDQYAHTLANTPEEHQVIRMWTGHEPTDHNLVKAHWRLARRLADHGILLLPHNGTDPYRQAATIADRYATPQEREVAKHVWSTRVAAETATLAELGLTTVGQIALAYAICDAHLHQDLHPDPCRQAITAALDITGN